MTDEPTVISLTTTGSESIEVILRAPDPETLVRAALTLHDMNAELDNLLRDLDWGTSGALNPLVIHLDRRTQICLGVIVTDPQSTHTRDSVRTRIRSILTHAELPQKLTATVLEPAAAEGA